RSALSTTTALAESNAAREAEHRRVHGAPSKRGTTEELTDKQKARLRATGEARALLYTVLVGTGLRPGEASRLRWQDLDADVQTTMRHYTDLRLLDLAEAVEKAAPPAATLGLSVACHETPDRAPEGASSRPSDEPEDADAPTTQEGEEEALEAVSCGVGDE